MVSVLSDTGRQSLAARYSAYGVPFGIPAGDLNADGAVDFTDSNQIASWIAGSIYDVRADINLDGVVDATHQTLLSGANYGLSLGRGKLAAGQTSSAWAPGVRRGYAGYEHDGVVNPVMHVRNRVLLGELGRWTRRDPLGYVDGSNLYAYARNYPVLANEAFGLSPALPSLMGDECGGTLQCDIAQTTPPGQTPPPKRTPPSPPSTPPAPYTKAECNQEVLAEYNAGGKVSRIRTALAGLGLPKPNLICSDTDHCTDGGILGYFLAPLGVYMCYQHIPHNNPVRFSRTAAHESLHFYDAVTELGSGGTNDPIHHNFGPNGDCLRLACTEVRAYTYDGDCPSDNWECVKERAVGSLRSTPCSNVEAYVENVKERCFINFGAP